MRKIQKIIVAALVVLLMLSTFQPTYGAKKNSSDKLNQLGLLLNISEAELSATLTREVGLTMILKALGYTQEEANEYMISSPFADTNGWSNGWASLAYYLNITTGTSSTTFEPEGKLTEKEFITFLLRSLGHESTKAYSQAESLAKENNIIGINRTIGSGIYTKEDAANAIYNALSATYLPEDIPLVNLLMEKGLFSLNEAVNVGLKEGNLEILRIKVLSAHEYQVVFNQSVDQNKMAFQFDDRYDSYEAIASWNGSRNRANIVTADDMINGTYNLTATYQSTNSLEYVQSFRIARSSVATVEIPSESINYGENGIFKVWIRDTYNQMMAGEEIKVQVINLTRNINLDTINSGNEVYEIENMIDSKTEVGDILEIEVTYNNKTVSKELEVVNETETAMFEIMNPVVNNGRLSIGGSNYILAYSYLDINKADKNLATHFTNQDGKSNSETIGDFTFTSSNSGVVNVDKIKVNTDGTLKFNTGNSSGATVLKVTNDVTNEIVQSVITVYPKPELNKVVIHPLSEVIAINESAELVVDGYDQFGAKMNIGHMDGLKYHSSKEEIVPSESMALGSNEFRYEGIEVGRSTLTVYTSDDEVLFTLFVSIEAEAEPLGISEISAPKYFEASSKAGYKVSYDDIHVVDQYGREYDLSENDVTILIEHEEATKDVIDIGRASFSSGTLNIKGSDTKGTGSYTFSMDGYDISSLTVDIETISEEDILNYQLEDIKELKTGDSNTQIITLKGLTEGLEEVVIAKDTIDFVTVSNKDLVITSYDGNEITVKGKEGTSGGKVTLQVWGESGLLAESRINLLSDQEGED